MNLTVRPDATDLAVAGIGYESAVHGVDTHVAGEGHRVP